MKNTVTSLCDVCGNEFPIGDLLIGPDYFAVCKECDNKAEDEILGEIAMQRKNDPDAEYITLDELIESMEENDE